MAAGNTDIHIKIQALIEGLTEVSALTSGLEELDQAGRLDIPDNTRGMRQGADDTSASIVSLKGKIGKLVAAAGGLTAIGAYLKSSAREVTDYDTRFRVLEQTIKATGGAAGFSADEIRKLSRELASATLGSVEGFENAANKLLTFRSITGETFTEALELAQDLAQAGFGTLESNAVQLGKALEDPVRGMSALTRAAVTFTAEQEQVIQKLMETGEKGKAQAIILEAVAGQVGGVGRAAAEGLAGAFDDLSLAFEEVRLATGKAIEPALISFYKALTQALEFVAENMDEVIRVAASLGAALLALAARNVIVGIIGITTQIAAMATGMGAATVAATALAAAQRAIPMVALASAAGAAVYGLLRLRDAKKGAQEEAARLAETEKRLIDRLAEIAEATGVAVTNMEEFNAAVKNGQLVWDEATATWLSAAQAAEALAKAEAEAARETKGLNQTLDDQLGTLTQLDPAVRALEDAYKELGITSPRALEASRLAARQALDTLIANEASVETLQRAFQVYADRAIAANEGVVDATLRAEAAAYGLSEVMDNTGRVTAFAMNEAGQATRAAAGAMQALGTATAATSQSTVRLSDAQRALRLEELQGEMTRLSAAVRRGEITQNEYRAAVQKIQEELRRLRAEQAATEGSNASLARSNQQLAQSFDQVADSAANARMESSGAGRGSNTGKSQRHRRLAGPWDINSPDTETDIAKLEAEVARHLKEQAEMYQYRGRIAHHVGKVEQDWVRAMNARIAQLRREKEENEEIARLQRQQQLAELRAQTSRPSSATTPGAPGRVVRIELGRSAVDVPERQADAFIAELERFAGRSQ